MIGLVIFHHLEAIATKATLALSEIRNVRTMSTTLLAIENYTVTLQGVRFREDED